MKRFIAVLLLLALLVIPRFAAQPALAPALAPPAPTAPVATPTPPTPPAPPAAPPPAPAVASEITLLFAGDLMLARRPGEYIARGEDPFAAFAGLLTGVDLSVGNLECVVATLGEAVPKAYNFRCHPRTVPLLARYFGAVSLANNHTGDYGPDAFAEQLDLLKAGGVRYFGGGRNAAEAYTPLILDVKGLKVALLGYNDVELRSYEAGEASPGLAWILPERFEAGIRLARQQADIVVVYPHWGYEYQSEHSRYQRDLATRWIDLGADLVVGNHPHVTQPVEIYKERLIAYSLGNFVFDDFLDVPPELDEPSRTSWLLKVTIGRDGIRSWETIVARTDDRGFPQPLRNAPSPCSRGKAEGRWLCSGAAAP